MGSVIPLRPDRYLPLKFETPPFEAYEMHEQYEQATALLQFAQTARNEIYQRSEPLSEAKREALMAISFIIEDLIL